MRNIAVMNEKDVTRFLQDEFGGYTRSKVGKRLVMLRDVSDAARCYAHSLWKPCVILCGGAIEGILSALLDGRPTRQVADAWTSVAEGQRPKALKDYTLQDKISVAGELGILARGSALYGQGLRNYRNYVHPEAELKTGYPLAQGDARIALELVLKLLDEVAV
jgi:hypothetical protein